MLTRPVVLLRLEPAAVLVWGKLQGLTTLSSVYLCACLRKAAPHLAWCFTERPPTHCSANVSRHLDSREEAYTHASALVHTLNTRMNRRSQALTDAYACAHKRRCRRRGKQSFWETLFLQSFMHATQLRAEAASARAAAEAAKAACDEV
eukprot:6197452-Pleurochrysis_carterae.AAC.3